LAAKSAEKIVTTNLPKNAPVEMVDTVAAEL